MKSTSPSDSRRVGAGGRLVSGRYRLVDEIGRGGMGVVWRAWDEMIQRNVAIKEVRHPVGLSPKDVALLNERTLREARAAGRLSSPHVVTVFDVVVDDDQPWIVMELLQARSLAEVISEAGRLAPQRAARIGLAVLAALDEAHRSGMLHRDIKPGNVMLGHDDWVTLTDFGLATTSGDPHLTRAGLLVGSPSYIAPERARGTTDLRPASDLWSLGATLFSAVEGRSPFERTDAISTLSAVLTEEPSPMRNAGPLEEVIEGLLRKDPRERYDAGRTRELLEAVAALPPDPHAAPGDTVPDPTLATDSAVVSATLLVPRQATAENRASHLFGDTLETWPPDSSIPTPPPTAPAPRRPLGDAPATRRTPGRPKRARLALATLIVLVLGTLLGYAFTTAGDRDETDAQTGTPSPSVSPTADDIPSPTATQPPDGYVWYTAAGAFTVAVPEGWVHTGTGVRSDFSDPSGGGYLRIEYGPANPAGALGAWQQAEAAWSTSAPDYHLIRLVQVDYRGWDAADWEWTDSNDGRARHVLDRTFVVGATGYAVMLDTLPDQWSELSPVFATATETFTPLG